MADAIRTQIVGLRELKAKLLKLSDVGEVMGSALLAGGYIIEGGAKIRCPVDTGNLRGSIGARRLSQDDRSASVMVGTGVEYAAAVEFGFHGVETVRAHQRRSPLGGMHTVRQHSRSVHRAARPYLRPAFDESRGIVLETISAQLRRALQERAR
ncbi:MAG: HK97 gp10 family phage protein [Acidobacteria bacterium]|nr:HK97 gp10 family phage protein [Acidobacteriota bacterium]